MTTMGTAIDSVGGQVNGEASQIIIPWSCVNFCIIKELVHLLNPDSLLGKDWKGLASRLGYSTALISSIESEKSNNTEQLFSDYRSKPNASFNKVYSCLEEMDMQECLDILNKNFPDIKRAFTEYQQQSQLMSSYSSFHLNGREDDMHYWSSHSNPPGACGGCMSQPVMSPHPYGMHHSCCSVVHGFGHHQHRMPTCPPAGATHPHKPLHYNCNPASMYMPSHLQMNVQFDPPLGHNPVGNSSPSTPQSRNTPGLPGAMSPSHKGSIYNFNRSDGHPQASHDGGVHPEGMPRSSSVHPLQHQGYHQTYTNGMSNRSSSEETSAQAAAQSHHHHPFKPFENNKRLQQYNISPQENYNLNSNMSTSSNNSNSINSVNSWPAVDNGLSPSQMSLLANDTAANARLHDDTPSYSQMDPVDSKDSLNKLFRISKVPQEYQPTEEYTRFVAEQKVEEKKNNKPVKNNDHQQTPSLASSSSSGSSKSNAGRSGSTMTESSHTYPLRVKIQAKTNEVARDFASISIKKSPSVPQSYKPQEYQRVHGTRLFVTYSTDSDKHKADILSLSLFLKENNFKSFNDIKTDPSSTDCDKKSEYLVRLNVADHVLVCISEKYLEDISKPDPPPPTERQLHTHRIYHLLRQEHFDNMKKEPSQPRPVILLFGSVTSDMVPEWMRKYPTYKWPSEYKDLYWILTKPEDKIIAKCANATNGKNCE